DGLFSAHAGGCGKPPPDFLFGRPADRFYKTAPFFSETAPPRIFEKTHPLLDLGAPPPRPDPNRAYPCGFFGIHHPQSRRRLRCRGHLECARPLPGRWTIIVALCRVR